MALPVLAVLMFLVMLSVVFPAVLLTVMLAMTCLVLRHINIIVPSVFYEIDRPAAGIIFSAMLAPLLFMTGGTCT
jgi:hypothetical protein